MARVVYKFECNKYKVFILVRRIISMNLQWNIWLLINIPQFTSINQITVSVIKNINDSEAPVHRQAS